MKRSMILAAVLSVAYLQPVRALDLSVVIRDLDTKCPFQDELAEPGQFLHDNGTNCPKTNRPPLTLGKAIYYALMGSFPAHEPGVAGEEKYKRALLAVKVRPGGDVALSLEDRILIKKVTGMMYSPPVVLVLWPMIEGESKKE